MRSRGLVVAVALVLAALAAGAVILYTNGVKKEAVSGGELTTVIVATQEIPANTPLTPLIAGGGFRELSVPNDAVVDGAVTSLDELKGRTTTSPLLANEQISVADLDTGEAPAGGALGISKGHLALTFTLNAPEGGFGYIQRGDNVSVFATYNGTSIIPGTIQDLVSGNAEDAKRQELPDFTATIIPTVRVLAVENPGVDEEGNKRGETVTLTLDLTPQDAQALVFATENALVWVGLLPPGEDGTQPPATQVPVELLLGKRGALA
ncbi:MAG: Flp pilus assembly protein CpaB [Actinomycetota bacterium]